MSDLSSFDKAFVTPLGVGIRRGLFGDLTGIQKFGYNSAVGSVAYETVWDGNNLYTYIATAGTAVVTSSNTAADNTGTVLVQGLDANYNEVEETLTIGGSAGTVEFYRVFRAILVNAATGTSNVGTVTITVDSKSAAIINPGNGQTLMALYTVPAGKRAYIVQVDVGSSKDLEHTITIVTRNGTGNAFNTKSFHTQRGGFNEKNYAIPIVVNEKTDIEMRCKSSATSAVSGGFEMILEDK